MDTLHSVLRTLRGERPRQDHLTVFREFLNHLDRVNARVALRDVKASRGVKRKANPKLKRKRGKRG
jgi:hypothetical protein